MTPPARARSTGVRCHVATELECSDHVCTCHVQSSPDSATGCTAPSSCTVVRFSLTRLARRFRNNYYDEQALCFAEITDQCPIVFLFIQACAGGRVPGEVQTSCQEKPVHFMYLFLVAPRENKKLFMIDVNNGHVTVPP